jgi:hypothetical protein
MDKNPGTCSTGFFKELGGLNSLVSLAHLKLPAPGGKGQVQPGAKAGFL